jgi:simple sugar transport system permease protein
MIDSGILLNSFLMIASILLIGAVSGYFSERCGIVNVGIDGMMCVGALFFAIYSSPVIGISKLGFGTIVIVMALSMFSTMIVGVLHAFATITLKSNQIISGTAINISGLAIATFLNKILGKTFYNGASKLESGFSPNASMYLGNGLYISSFVVFGIVLFISILV